MNNLLKYLGLFFLVIIGGSLAFCSMGVYQGLNTANRIFAGADNYTCRQFLYDMEHPETDKFAPMLIAAIAYGSVEEPTVSDTRRDELVNKGIEPAVRKTYTLCKNKPNERVINLFAATITASTSGTVVTPTTPQTAQ